MKRYLKNGPTQGLGTKFTAEALYPINFTQSKKRFELSLHFNGSNSCLFINATKVYHLKVNDSEDYTLCLVNVSDDFTINNIKNQD